VSAGAEGAARGVQQRPDCGRRFYRSVDQVFVQGAEDAVACGINPADVRTVAAHGFNHAAG